MNGQLICALSLALLCSGLVACSKDDELKACPTSGLGVSASDGTSCVQASRDTQSTSWKDCWNQVTKWREYSCATPQICPNMGVDLRNYYMDPNQAGQEMSFILTNCSTGGQKLNVSKIELWVDKNADADSFTQPELAVGGLNTATSGEAITFRTIFFPSYNKTDPTKPINPCTDSTRKKYCQCDPTNSSKCWIDVHAKLLIYSNGGNFNPLKIPICGRGFTWDYSKEATTETADGGVAKDAATSSRDTGSSTSTKFLTSCLGVYTDPTVDPQSTDNTVEGAKKYEVSF